MKRVLSVLTVALLMAAMMLAMGMPAFAQVERGTCLEGIPCSQGVLLPDEPVGNVIEEGFGQASSACPAIIDNTAEHGGGGAASENQTFEFFHCFVGSPPIE